MCQNLEDGSSLTAFPTRCETLSSTSYLTLFCLLLTSMADNINPLPVRARDAGVTRNLEPDGNGLHLPRSTANYPANKNEFPHSCTSLGKHKTPEGPSLRQVGSNRIAAPDRPGLGAPDGNGLDRPSPMAGPGPRPGRRLGLMHVRRLRQGPSPGKAPPEGDRRGRGLRTSKRRKCASMVYCALFPQGGCA
jgi:hypothetical protein